MESPYANLFLAIQDRIMDQVPEIKYIDQNMGQYLKDEFRNNMLFPCLLIDFPATTFTGLQGDNQLGDTTVIVTLFHDIWNNTNSITPIAIKEAGLKYLEIDQKIFMALQGWCPDFCTPFTRGQNKSQNNNDVGLMVRETYFSFEFEDYSCDNAEQIVQFRLSE